MIEAVWCWNLEDKIASNRDAGHAAIEKLLSALEQAGWDGRDYFHVQMSVEEAMINAITHGNQSAEDKIVELEFKVSKQKVYLRIKDEGAGFCPSKLPDPRSEERLNCTHGRGVLLIHELMNQVTYNQRGNEVVMIKNRGEG